MEHRLDVTLEAYKKEAIRNGLRQCILNKNSD